ncbi:hypothetical protein M0812_07098 [Anaeramoeba flamelloides]|uniref:Uncharacterized protein n=1 Tax=Anaeramoeba flamelloides TaxID=1746091 RepID=A0AAV8ABF9_9EUKA|nr:hypothetical protein M0812_07098 [Anaeramoeba flamelloides]
MSKSDVLAPQVPHFKAKPTSQKQFGKIRFGRFCFNIKGFSSNQTKNSTKQKRSTTKMKTKINTKTKTKQGKFKKALRRKLKNRTRKEKSAITALVVLSSNKTQKKNQETNGVNQKKTQDQNQLFSTKAKSAFSQTKEPYPNLINQQEQDQDQEQEQEKEQKVKEKGIDLNHLRSLYSKYEKPTIIKKNTLEPSVQQPFSGYKSTILTHVEVPNSEDTTSTNDQLEGQSYDDSFSEDIVSFSDEESERVSANNPRCLNHMNEIHFDEDQYYTVSDEEMESIGDEITISFGKIDNLTNTHQLISPQNYFFASESFGKTSSCQNNFLYCGYNNNSNEVVCNY